MHDNQDLVSNEVRRQSACRATAALGIRRLRMAASLFGLLLVAGNSHALPILSEVYYDAVGSDNGQSFVEIHGAPGTPLDGLRLEGVNGSNGAIGPVVALSGVIPDDGLFVVADSTSDGTSQVTGADLFANFDFQNGPDSIVLIDGEIVLDAVGYGTFAPADVFAGEGSPAPDPPAGASLARVFADLDSNDNAVDFHVLDLPTPGAADFASVPEPGTGLLSMIGLTALSIFYRQRPREMP